jgi:hypothetical protein
MPGDDCIRPGPECSGPQSDGPRFRALRRRKITGKNADQLTGGPHPIQALAKIGRLVAAVDHTTAAPEKFFNVCLHTLMYVAGRASWFTPERDLWTVIEMSPQLWKTVRFRRGVETATTFLSL